MNDHQILKRICDDIWYEYQEYGFYFKEDLLKFERCKLLADVREIIFTEEFINKFMFKLAVDKELFEVESRKRCEKIIYHLNNPVEFINNLLK